MKRAKLPFKSMVAAMAVALFSLPVQAQDEVDEFGIFDHLSVGLTLGTTGIGIDLAAPVTEYLQVRAGYDYFSGFSHKEDVNYRAKGQPTKKTEVKGDMNLSNAKLLLDIFPFKGSMFRVTTGFYLGTDAIVKAENTIPVLAFDEGEGLLGVDVADKGFGLVGRFTI